MAGVAPCLAPIQPDGDANGDLAVDVLDVQCVITALLEGGACTALADATHDGRIDVLDYQAILQQVNGKHDVPARDSDSSKQTCVKAILRIAPYNAPMLAATVAPVRATPQRNPLQTADALHFNHRLKHERYVRGLRSHAPPYPV